MANRMPHGKPPSQRRGRGSEPDEPDVFVSVPSTWKKKPILLTAPTVQDLAPYGPDMLRALAAGYAQGIEAPCVLVIWRGSAYAKEHGLAASDTPLTFRPISAAEVERLTGRKPYPGDAAEDMLPLYMFATTGLDEIRIDVATDMSEDGAVLAWRHSRHFRRQYGPLLGGAAVEALEGVTGVGRDD